MTVATIKLSFVVVGLLASFAEAENDLSWDISDHCFQCMYDYFRGDLNEQCFRGQACGYFYISRDYWWDGGALTINGLGPRRRLAFSTCVRNLDCAKRTIQGYMNKHAKECNGDKYIDCRDYFLIHKFGPEECNTTLINSTREAEFISCAHKNPWPRYGPDVVPQTNTSISPSTEREDAVVVTDPEIERQKGEEERAKSLI